HARCRVGRLNAEAPQARHAAKCGLKQPWFASRHPGCCRSWHTTGVQQSCSRMNDFTGRLRKRYSLRRGGLLAGAAAASPSRNALKVDVTVSVPDVDVDAEAGRCATEADLHATQVLVWFEFQIADIVGVYSTHELVVLLLLFS